MSECDTPISATKTLTPPLQTTFARLIRAQKIELLEQLIEKKRRAERNFLATYKPYPKQREFHAAGAAHRERLLMASSQSGKTLAGGCEDAYHLTGLYPPWWEGRRFSHPTRGWAASESNELVRDGIQRLLIGSPHDESQWGTGCIPGDKIVSLGRKQGVKNALDHVVVKHVSGGNSVLGFRTYVQGRLVWQAETLHWVHFDEEPPPDIYSEGLTRTNATMGFVFMTFTPLLGHSQVVQMFIDEYGLP